MTQHNVLQRGQAIETNRATCMQLVIRDTNLGTKTILKAIRKARAGINHHTGTIHFPQEAVCSCLIGRDDGIGMFAAIALNVIHCFIQRCHRLNRQNWRKVFGGPIVFCRIHQILKTRSR